MKFGLHTCSSYFCSPLKRPLRLVLAYSIMVVRQILVLFVLVRIQVGQLKMDKAFFVLSIFLLPPSCTGNQVLAKFPEGQIAVLL